MKIYFVLFYFYFSAYEMAFYPMNFIRSPIFHLFHRHNQDTCFSFKHRIDGVSYFPLFPWMCLFLRFPSPGTWPGPLSPSLHGNNHSSYFSWIHSVVGWVMAPWNLWTLFYVVKKDFTDVIKFKILRWADHSGFFWWALNTIHISL